MNSSETIAALAKALAAFQTEVKDPKKDNDNPFFKSKYVALDGLTAAVRPVLAKHGLSYMQFPTGDGQTVSMTTLLLHESGEYIESEPFTMRPAKADPQGIGSCMTYARRYSLQSVLGVAWEDDDDANNASQPTQQAKAQDANKNTRPQQKTSQAANTDKSKALLKQLQDTMKKEQLTNEDITMLINETYHKPKWSDLTIAEQEELAGKTLELWQQLMERLGGKTA